MSHGPLSIFSVVSKQFDEQKIYRENFDELLTFEHPSSIPS